MTTSHQEETQQQVLLSVLAHPDDESFGMGGTLALYAEQGVEVHLICATRGEVGEVPEDCLDGYQSIAELREQELRCAAEHLGIREIHFLDYRDSGMVGSPENNHPRALMNAPLEEVARKVADLILEIQPQVVVTFDPIGGYRHPDHIAMHQAAKDAFYKVREQNKASGNNSGSPQKLYYHTISRRFIRLNVQILKLMGKDPSRWGANQDIDLTALAVDDFPVHARIDYRRARDRKSRAAACHASQGGGGFTRGYFQWFLRLIGVLDRDQFMRDYPEPVDGHIERDLFQDLE